MRFAYSKNQFYKLFLPNYQLIQSFIVHSFLNFIMIHLNSKMNPEFNSLNFEFSLRVDSLCKVVRWCGLRRMIMVGWCAREYVKDSDDG